MTKGQIEAKISEVVAKFEIEFIGRGPKNIKTMILEDLVVIRLIGFLSPVEQNLAKTDKGVELVKQSRMMLFEGAVEYFKELIKNIINIDIISVHSDVSTKTGEKVIIITLSEKLLFD